MVEQAEIYYLKGDLDQAMTLLKEGEALCRQTGLIPFLIKNLIEQSEIRRENGEAEVAIELLKEAMKFAQQIDNKEFIAEIKKQL